MKFTDIKIDNKSHKLITGLIVLSLVIFTMTSYMPPRFGGPGIAKAATPPTFIQEVETSWTTNASVTASVTTASFNVVAGDVLVATGISANDSVNISISDNTSTSGNWINQQTIDVFEYNFVGTWTKVVTNTESMTVTFSRTGSADVLYGGSVITFRGSDGVGASNKTNVSSGAPSLSLTTTADNSAVVVANGDWVAVDGSSRTWRTVNSITPTSGNGFERTYFRNSAQYTNYIAYYSDVGAIGADTHGLSAPGSQKYSITAVEIKGAASAGITISGTCKQTNQSTDCSNTAGNSIRVAVNGTIQAQTDATVDGSWSIASVTAPANNDIVTVFIEGEAASSSQAVAVTKYGGSGNIGGIELIEAHLSVGSDQNNTITNADLSQYDSSVSNKRTFHDVSGSTLTVDVNSKVSSEELYIQTGDTFQPDSAGGDIINTCDVEINGTFDLDSNVIAASGSWDNNATFIANTGSVSFTGIGSETVSNNRNAFYHLEIDSPNNGGTLTFNDTDVIASGQLEIETGDTVSISSNRKLTHTGSALTLNGTISGAGKFVYRSTTAFPTSGTVSSILVFDAQSGNQTMSNRTYGGQVEITNNSTTTGRTVTMSSSTHTLSSNLYVVASTSQNITLAGATNDPTVDITGDLDFTGAGSGTETITSGANMWTVSGNVDFTSGTFTVESGNTLDMDGSSKTLTSNAQTLENLTLSGTITLANATHTVDGNLNMASGTVTAGSSTITMTGTSNTITGGGETLNNLTINPSSTGTITLQTSNLTVSGQVIVAAGDTFAINSGQTLTLSGSGTPLMLYSTSVFSPNSASTVQYTGTSATTIAPATYGILSLVPAGTVTYTLASASGQTIAANGLFTIGNSSNAVTVTAATRNPTINLFNDFTIAAGAIFASGSGTTVFKSGGTQTLTDSTTSKQNLGEVRVSVNGTDTILNLGSDIRIASATIDLSQTFSLNGSKTLTITGINTPFTINGTFTPSTGTVKYTGTTATVTATTFNNLTLGGTGTYTMPASAINIQGNLIITSGTTVNKGAGIVTFKGGTTQTWTDNTAGQDLGTTQISGNSIVNIPGGTTTKFLEPGTDATQDLTFYPFTTTSVGTVTSDNTQSHTGPRSLKANVTSSGSGNIAVVRSPSSVVSDAGAAISIWVKFSDATPGSAFMFLAPTQVPSGNITVIGVGLTTTGKIRVSGRGTTAIDGTTTLSDNTWYRVSLAYKVTSASDWDAKVYLGTVADPAGALEVSTSDTDGTLGAVTTSNVTLGINTSAAVDSFGTGPIETVWIDDVYVDNRTDLTDPGNILVTAKRPLSNGTTNEFTTQIGSGNSGYGSDNANEVNEQPLSATNGWSVSTTTRKTEEYTIESAATGDVDLTGVTLIDYMGWIWASVDSTSNSPVHRIIVNGVATAKTMTTGAAFYSVVAGSATYPTGNTDIGMDAQYTTTPHLTNLFETGIVFAYAPANTNTTLNLGSSVKATSLTIDSAQIFSANGSNALTLTGTDTPLISNGTFTRSTGSVIFTGNDSTNIPALNYYDLKVQPSANSVTHTFLAGTASVSKTFTVGNGTNTGIIVTANGASTGLDVASVSISANSTLVAHPSNEFTVGGNWRNNGSFTHSSGTVTFAFARTASVSGGTTFNNFTSTTAGKKIKFNAGQTFGFAGNFTITGGVGNTVKIESTASASQWIANFSGAQSGVTYATITNSGCDSSSADVSLNSTSINGGNNGTCWFAVNVTNTGGGGGGSSEGAGGGTPTGGGSNPGGGGGSSEGSGGGTPTGGGGSPGGGGGSSPIIFIVDFYNSDYLPFR